MAVRKGRVFEIRDGVKTYYSEGQSFREGEAGSSGGRHIVGNDSNEEAVTYHLYGGKLEMQTFPDDPSEITALETTVEA